MNSPYLIIFRTVNGIDLFTRKQYCDLIAKSIRYYQKSYGLDVHAFVIMPSRIYLIASQQEGVLHEVIRSFKHYSTQKIVEALQKSDDERRGWILNAFSTAGLNSPSTSFFEVWNGASNWEVINSNGEMEQQVNRIHTEPVRAGFVQRAEDYYYSSAGKKSEQELPDIRELINPEPPF